MMLIAITLICANEYTLPLDARFRIRGTSAEALVNFFSFMFSIFLVKTYFWVPKKMLRSTPNIK